MVNGIALCDKTMLSISECNMNALNLKQIFKFLKYI